MNNPPGTGSREKYIPTPTRPRASTVPPQSSSQQKPQTLGNVNKITLTNAGAGGSPAPPSPSGQRPSESVTETRNVPFFALHGNKAPTNSLEAMQQFGANSINIKYDFTTRELGSMLSNEVQTVANVSDDPGQRGVQFYEDIKRQNDKELKSYEEEKPVVQENAKKRTDILDIRQRLKKCFWVVHSIIALCGIGLIVAGCLIDWIDQQILGNLELNLNDLPKKLYIGTGGSLILIAVLAQIVLRIQKFKILTWLLYLLILCVAASTVAACSFTSLRSYKNHNVARSKLYELMNLYNGKKGPATEKWDVLQQGYSCCGVDNFMDWTDYPYGRTSLRTPMSCCRNYNKEKDLYCGQNLLPVTDINVADGYVFAKGCITNIMDKADVWYLSSGLSSGFMTVFIVLHWLFCFFLITSHRL